jgi:PIN domain nuclease of toxin-antitoxin system
MRLLLDTHVFIWWDSNPGQISPAALAALRDPANTLLLSPISIWEMSIKLQLGKLKLRMPLRDIVANQQANGIGELPVTAAHALAVDRLPTVHRDPFDRFLIAQAQVEGIGLISADHVFTKYPVQVIW